MWGKVAIGCLLGAALLLPAEADAQRRKKGKRARTGMIQPSRSQAAGTAYYPNCAAARAAGAAPIRAGNPGYSRKLDRDGDGVACE